jgi:hypothetical protein
MNTIDKARLEWKRFVAEYLSGLKDEHEYISKKEDFSKMCKKWGMGYLQYIDAAWLARDRETMTEKEFRYYNGIPESIDIDKLSGSLPPEIRAKIA